MRKNRTRIALALLSLTLWVSDSALAAGDPGVPCQVEAPRVSDAVSGLTLTLEDTLSSPLERASRNTAQVLDGAGTPVPAQDLEGLWKIVESELPSSELKDQPGINFLKPRIYGLLQDLIRGGKVRYLTEDAKKRLGIDSYLCDDGRAKCKQMSAFYVPLTGHVFLDGTLPKNEQANALFHELVHAYQYTYRLPLDAETLDQIARSGRLPKEQLTNFLSYFYEAQAHWYTMKLTPPKAWDDQFQTDPSTSGQAESNIFLVLKSVFVGGANLIAARAEANHLLPKVDQSAHLLHLFGKDAALRPSELVFLSGYRRHAAGVNYDFGFHERFGTAIERTYFGSLPFLFEDDRDDLKIANRLYDQYYDRIGLDATVDKDPRCKALLDKVRVSGTSPMVEWLTLPKEEIEACKPYSGKGGSSYRDEFTGFTLNSVDSASPFGVIRMDGSEGSRPNLIVNPSVRVQPQLEVLPVGGYFVETSQ